MALRRDWFATAVLTALLVVLPVVAVLQYRVLTSAAEGEVAQLRRAAANAARQIRSDLALEMAGLSSILLSVFSDSPVEPSSADVLEVAHAAADVWRSQARFPELLEAIEVVESAEAPRSTPQSAQVDPRGKWVISLPIGRVGRGGVGAATPNGGTARDVFQTPHVLLIHIDPDVLVDTIIPLLVDEALGLDATGFQATVLDHGSGTVLYSTAAVEFAELLSGGVAVEESVHFATGETLQLGIYGVDRPQRLPANLVQQWLALRGWGDDQPSPGERARTLQSGIVLYIWHAAGSIERAALADRNRNFALSSAVMAAFAAAAIVFHGLLRRANLQREREREFVATVTHELRTPVAAIYATAENLAEGIVTRPERVAEYGRALLDAGQRLRRMVDQTLFYAGLEGGARRVPHDRLEVEPLVARALDGVRELDRAALSVLIESGIPGLRGDLVAVESVLVNLLSNSVKHNPSGTPIRLEIHYTASPPVLTLRVSDRGQGIPRRELRRVCEPFYRGRRSREGQVPGTGVGLNLVSRIADAYHGTLDIGSVEGEGSDVTVELPFEPFRDDTEDTDRRG